MSYNEKKDQINNEDQKNEENEGDSDYLTINSNSKKSRNDSLGPLQSKYSQKEKNNNTSVGVIHKTSTTDKINLRKDAFGNEIKKGGQHKITFGDDEIFKNENKDTKKNKDNFIEIIDVESYKLDNQLLMLLDDRYPGENICCESCFVF
jgi:hypothetical protein